MKQLMQRAYEANMELWKRGLVVYTWGNVSEVDRDTGLVAIKPSGVPYDVLCPEDMAVLELASGRQVAGKLRPSSDTPTHLALYRAFTGVGGVTHTHSRHAAAWAQAGKAIPCYGTTHADYFYRDIPCARGLTQEEVEGDYEAATGAVIIEAFEGREPLATPGVLVKNHGPFTWGGDGMRSVESAVVLEEVAAMACLTLSIHNDSDLTPDYLMDKHYYRKHGEKAYYGQKNL